MLENRYASEAELKKIGRSEDVKLLHIIQENPVYLAFTKKQETTALISRFNSTLKETIPAKAHSRKT